jgi:hypothetical protein
MGDIVDGVDDTSSLNPANSSWLDQYGVTSADIGTSVYDANVTVTPVANDPTTTPANQQAWTGVTNLVTSLLTNVGAPALTNLVNSSVYGQPAYYIRTADGKQAPVWKASDGRFFTIDGTGAQTWLPATPAAPPATKSVAAAAATQWMMVAAIGAAALLLITLVIKKK